MDTIDRRLIAMHWYDSMTQIEKFFVLFWNITQGTSRTIQSVTNAEIEELYWSKYHPSYIRRTK
jgi:hypothetical protein